MRTVSYELVVLVVVMAVCKKRTQPWPCECLQQLGLGSPSPVPENTRSRFGEPPASAVERTEATFTTHLELISCGKVSFQNHAAKLLDAIPALMRSGSAA